MANLRELKILAQTLKPMVRVGKAGVTAALVAELRALLERNGTVKLKFEDFKDERKALSKRLAEETGSVLVQQVGHTAVFHRAKAGVNPESL